MDARHSKGFNLVELMVTVVVLAILTTLAYPGMRNLTRRNQTVAVSNGFMADLQYARGQAAATRTYVSVCPRATTTDNTCATTGSYDLGWVIYTSPKANVAYAASTATPDRVEPAVSGVSVRSSANGPVTYNARGELLVTGGGDATFVTCSKLSSSDAEGANTSQVPGIQINASHSGRVGSSTLAAGTTCDG